MGCDNIQMIFLQINNYTKQRKQRSAGQNNTHTQFVFSAHCYLQVTFHKETQMISVFSLGLDIISLKRRNPTYFNQVYYHSTRIFMLRFPKPTSTRLTYNTLS